MTSSEEKPPVPPASPSEVEIRGELQRILGSPVFRGSKRCQDFLTFVVLRALEGNADRLKERTLAVEIFGRSAGADLTDDSIVRVGAREVRKRLAQYYMTDGAGDALRIELPAGSYVPAFQVHRQEEPPPQTAPMAAVVELLPSIPSAVPASGPGKRRVPLWVPLASLILLGVVPLLVWQWNHRTPREFQNFWQPAFDQPGPLLLVIANPPVNQPSTNTSRLSPDFDQYAGFGDTVAAFRLAGLFAARTRPARLRLASKVELADMRDSATVLIGALANRWTVEISKKFRYHFALEEGRQPSIVDAATGTRRWSLEQSDYPRSNEDYIVLCRLPRSANGGFIVIDAGLTQYGTQEGGRILSEPDALVPLLRQLPGDWASKNVELVLHSQVVGDRPTPPDLLASYVW